MSGRRDTPYARNLESHRLLSGPHAWADGETHRWKRQEYTIRFRISDLLLFGVRRQALVRQTHFTGEHGTVDSLRLPAAQGGEIFYVPNFPAGRELPELAVRQGMLRYCFRRYDRHFIRLEGDFERYLAKFSAKSRKTLRRKAVLWTERNGGNPGVGLFDRPGEMEEYAALCRQVSARTYQQLVSGDGFPRDAAFVDELRSMAAQGRIRGYVLFEGARPAAYAHCFVPEGAPGALQYDTVGYDPEDRRWSPGTVLLFHILADLHRGGGIRIFDFGIGDHAYKRFFATDSLFTVDLLYFPDSQANRLLVGGHRMLRRLTAALRRAAELAGFSDRARRLLRKQ